MPQKASQLKSKELSPWLYGCSSQIIKNGTANWYQTYQHFMKDESGKPQFKPKSDHSFVYLTKEVLSSSRVLTI
jgi:putative transposase